MQSISQIFRGVFCFLIYGILFQASSGYANPLDENDFPLCHSQDCIRHANMIVKNMDTDIDPCQDFYSFVCGRYKKKFGENETRSVHDDAWSLLQKQIKDLVENLEPEEGSSSEKLKIVYENCMDVAYYEKMAVFDAVNILHDVGIPHWPLLNEGFIFSNLSETLGKLAAYGEFSFVNFKPSPYKRKFDDSNLQSPALILQGNFLLNSKLKSNDVHNSVIRILKYFNITENERNRMWQEFTEIENSGIRLQNEVSESPSSCKNTPKSTFREVNCSEATFGSMKSLCNFWRYAVEAGDLDKYYSTDILHISCSWSHFHYIYNIFSHLDKINDRSLANYLSLRFFISHLDDLNKYFHMTKRTFPGDKRSRTPQPTNRLEYCVTWIIKSMNHAIGFEYTEKILTKPIQNSVLDIIKDYIQELSSSIMNLDWLGDKIKLYLQTQLANLDIGFQKSIDNYRNKTLVESFYKMFSAKKGSFLRNILDFQKLSLVTKEKPLFNNLYSSSDPYTMDFGIALLQPPFFAQELPKIWNYAGLGSMIGHELSHNLKFFFDFVHIDETIEHYLDNKMQCFVQQYSQHIIEKTGKTITSSEVKEEIIAENLGWELTEKLILEVINNNSSELFKLPFLDYTPLQLAYISYAQDACAVLSKDVEAEFYATKPQNLPNLSVNGALQNSKTFSEVFNCKQGDLMYAKNKCIFFQ